MDIFLFLVAGAISGIASSVPVGPSNLWYVNAMVPPARPNANLVAFTAGVIFSDIACAAVSFWGFYHFFQGTNLGFSIVAIGSFALLVYGIRELFNARRLVNSKINPQKMGHWRQDFIFGVVLGSNPAFIIFWLAVGGAMNELGLMDLLNWPAPLFFLGLALGDIAWYSIWVKILRKGVNYISHKNLSRLRAAIGLGFILFGISALIKLIYYEYSF